VLLGSSGVGKSTIANRLLGQMVQEVQPVRESDSRGRHTTTTREMFVLPGGALLMDKPGLREMQLWDAEDGVAQVFADIDALARECRFGDCRHEGEPGCAVQAALDTGTLDRARVESRRKLLQEQEFLRRKVDPEARQEHKEQWKQIHRAARQKYEQREKDGGKRLRRRLLCRVMRGELRERDTLVDEVDDILSGSSGEKDFGDAGLLQGRDVGFGDDAADEDGDIVHAFFVEEFHELGADGVVRAGENGKADHVDVFLDGGGGDHLGGLAQAGVDDLHASVAQGASDNFCAAVVAVQPRLGD